MDIGNIFLLFKENISCTTSPKRQTLITTNSGIKQQFILDD